MRRDRMASDGKQLGRRAWLRRLWGELCMVGRRQHCLRACTTWLMACVLAAVHKGPAHSLLVQGCHQAGGKQRAR